MPRNGPAASAAAVMGELCDSCGQPQSAVRFWHFGLHFLLLRNATRKVSSKARTYRPAHLEHIDLQMPPLLPQNCLLPSSSPKSSVSKYGKLLAHKDASNPSKATLVSSPSKKAGIITGLHHACLQKCTKSISENVQNISETDTHPHPHLDVSLLQPFHACDNEDRALLSVCLNEYGCSIYPELICIVTKKAHPFSFNCRLLGKQSSTIDGFFPRSNNPHATRHSPFRTMN